MAFTGKLLSYGEESELQRRGNIRIMMIKDRWTDAHCLCLVRDNNIAVSVNFIMHA